MTVKVSLDELIQAGAHYGHQVRRWNPKMSEYIHSENKGVHIFDLIKTKSKLEEALNYLATSAKEGKSIIFVGTKKQVKEIIKNIAQETGSFYVNERWLGGTLTNFDQMRRSVRKMAEMKAKREEGGYKGFTKKERLLIDREIERLERFFSGISTIEKIPDVMIAVDVKKEFGAIQEARNMGMTTIGLVDSNSDPTSVDFPIPMNDDAVKALEYVLNLFKEVILKSKPSDGKSTNAKKEVKA